MPEPEFLGAPPVAECGTPPAPSDAKIYYIQMDLSAKPIRFPYEREHNKAIDMTTLPLWFGTLILHLKLP